MDELKRITGKSDIEINNLAKSMGVNLMDNTMEFTKVLEDLGVTVKKTAEEMNAATVSVYSNALKGFDKILEVDKAKEILDERAKGLAETYRAQGGKVTESQTVEFVRGQMESLLPFFKGNAGLALAESLKSFGKGGTGARGPLKGMNIDFGGNQAIQDVLNTAQSDYGLLAAGQINSMLNGKTVDAKQFQQRVKKMTPEQIANLANIAENGLGTGQAAFRKIEQAGSYEQAILNEIGMGDLVMKKIDNTTADLSTVSKDIADSTQKLIDQMKIYFTEANDVKPEWYTKESFEKLIKGGDTRTPRGQAFGDTTSSRLSQTMGRHAQINGMLTGTRTVTSGFRTYGLGSMNSDHVTGRAYDLVGQNLGQYQSLVRSTGGFAEFHGVNGARHLHVVPGSGAMGDNRVPVSMGARPQSVVMSGGGGGNSYSFYITGNQNASANEIAEMVMQKVKETERSNRERR
jgi:hypothetical protein